MRTGRCFSPSIFRYAASWRVSSGGGDLPWREAASLLDPRKPIARFYTEAGPYPVWSKWNCSNSTAVMFELRCSEFELFCSESASQVLARLSPQFEAMYARVGRPSVAPEKL